MRHLLLLYDVSLGVEILMSDHRFVKVDAHVAFALQHDIPQPLCPATPQSHLRANQKKGKVNREYAIFSNDGNAKVKETAR
jgi:hypothetical protein